MSVSFAFPSFEGKRFDLYNRLQEVLGTDPATTLMTYLPPLRTEDLLTREEFAEFTNEIRQFRSEVNQRFDRVLLALIGGMFVTLAAILWTATFS